MKRMTMGSIILTAIVIVAAALLALRTIPVSNTLENNGIATRFALGDVTLTDITDAIVKPVPEEAEGRLIRTFGTSIGKKKSGHFKNIKTGDRFEFYLTGHGSKVYFETGESRYIFDLSPEDAGKFTDRCRIDWWRTSEMEIIDSDRDVLHVLTDTDPEENSILRKISFDLTDEMISSPQYNILAGKMLDTVTSPEQDGVGIAGPQVGISRRIVAVLRYDKEGHPFEVYPNISIIGVSGEKESGPEGCLSVPGKRGDVLRYQDIEISYTNAETLQDTTEHITGYTAVIFQHECDHLEGILYTDKVISGSLQ